MTNTGKQVTHNASNERNGWEASIKAGTGGFKKRGRGDDWGLVRPKRVARQDRTGRVPPDSWYLRKVLELMP